MGLTTEPSQVCWGAVGAGCGAVKGFVEQQGRVVEQREWVVEQQEKGGGKQRAASKGECSRQGWLGLDAPVIHLG